jgi:predicted dehydrogenase
MGDRDDSGNRRRDGRVRVINWLVAGAGLAGRCHIAAIEHTDGAALAGIIDPHFAGPAPAPVYASLEAALAQSKADALIIATPNDRQAKLARAAIAAGVPVLCEKPVGVSLAEACALNDTARITGVPVGVVLNQRAQRHSRWIQGLIQNGDLRPQKIIFSGDLARLTGWHGDPARSGGGVLRMIGLHYLDVLLWWLGPPQEVQASLSGAPQDDRIEVTLSFASGSEAHLQINAVKDKATGPVTCVLEGEGVRIEMWGHEITSLAGLPDPPPPEPVEAAFFFGPGHLTVVAEATAALAQGQPFPVPLSEALPVLTLIEQIYRPEGETG